MGLITNPFKPSLTLSPPPILPISAPSIAELCKREVRCCGRGWLGNQTVPALRAFFQTVGLGPGTSPLCSHKLLMGPCEDAGSMCTSMSDSHSLPSPLPPCHPFHRSSPEQGTKTQGPFHPLSHVSRTLTLGSPSTHLSCQSASPPLTFIPIAALVTPGTCCSLTTP